MKAKTVVTVVLLVLLVTCGLTWATPPDLSGLSIDDLKLLCNNLYLKVAQLESDKKALAVKVADLELQVKTLNDSVHYPTVQPTSAASNLVPVVGSLADWARWPSPAPSSTSTPVTQPASLSSYGGGSIGYTRTGFPLYVGPRGGIYHYSANGNKVYEKN